MLDGRVDAFARHLISGWAADMDQPDASVGVVVVVDGQPRGTVRANLARPDLAELGTLGDGRHGFELAFDPPLSPLRSYEVEVVHAGTDQPLRLGRFTMAAETSLATERLRPLLVTTSGQPGFSDLMHGLVANPAVIAADSHNYGVKLMSYYARAAEVLMTPSGRVPSGAVVSTDEGAFILTSNPFQAPEYEAVFPEPRLLYEFFQKQAAAPICAAFETVVSDFYMTLAMHQGRHQPAYFAEQADLFDITRGFARIAFTDLREIVLVQDPRDAYCGYRALWSVSPTQTLETLRRVRDRTLQLHGEDRSDTWFLRTEDLRTRPADTMRAIWEFLGVNPDAVASPDMPQTAERDPAAQGVGRWKTELDNDEIAFLEREFGTYLHLFGYEMAETTQR